MTCHFAIFNFSFTCDSVVTGDGSQSLALRYNNVLPKVSGKVKHNITNENPEMIHMNQKVHLQLALTVKIEPKNGPKLDHRRHPNSKRLTQLVNSKI